MQISSQEVEKVVRRGGRRTPADAQPARSVEELAEKCGVEEAEVARYADAVRMAEEDPWRQRRVLELKARVEAGTYHVDAEQILDMAERRALADAAGG